MRVVVDKNNPLVAEAFQQFGEVRALATKEITAGAIRDADMVIVRSETKVTEELLRGSPVRFVGTATIGTDHVDVAYLRTNGIGFASAPGSNANSVAEYIVAALLTLAQRKGLVVQAKTIGVVGVGNVGSKVVRNAKALGMTVLQNDPPISRATVKTHFVPLDDLMDADFITLHVPLTTTGMDPTYHLFDAKRIGTMKKGAILINTARGSVVDSTALGDALDRRHLGGSVLDVWEGEPAIDVELLKKIDIATSHIAGYSFDGKLAAVEMVYAAACQFFGQAPTWMPEKSLPKPLHERIVVSDTGDSLEETLSKIVKKCYDIECDDRSLRGITAAPVDGVRSYFTRLRAEYGVRREFYNTTIELPAALASMEVVLKALGFSVVNRRV
jgi:erythronate-4-phosphate dehydrogenase